MTLPWYYPLWNWVDGLLPDWLYPIGRIYLIFAPVDLHRGEYKLAGIFLSGMIPLVALTAIRDRINRAKKRTERGAS
jgi:hypothetical protein